MGHIELPFPVFHPLFRRGVAGRAVRTLLGISATDQNQLLKGSTVIVTDPGDSGMEVGSLITAAQYESQGEQPGPRIKVETQAEAVRWLLRHAHFNQALERARQDEDCQEILRLLRDFQHGGNLPEWLVLDAIPVLPTGLRPIHFSPTGHPQFDDLNWFYARVLRGCSKIQKLVERNAPRVILLAAVWSLQRRVTALFLNPRGAIRRRVGFGTQRPLVRLLEKACQPLRQDSWTQAWPNSARLPLVPNPTLKWFQCGLPRSVATLKLFTPLLLDRFDLAGISREQAQRRLTTPDEIVWAWLDLELPRSAVLLTCHSGRSRSSLLAFQPMLTSGTAIQVSPLAVQTLQAGSESDDDVTAFVLSTHSACSEALVGMLSDQCRNPANGQLVYQPTPEMILGCYYLTRSSPQATELDVSQTLTGKRAAEFVFGSVADVVSAFERGAIDMRTRILLRVEGERGVVPSTISHRTNDREQVSLRIDTTVGRVLVNEVFPDSMPFLNDEINAMRLNERLQAVDVQFGPVRAMRVLDELQSVALAALTRSGLSLSQADLTAPLRKQEIFDEARKRVAKTKSHFERGNITEQERRSNFYDAWAVADEQLMRAMQDRLVVGEPAGVTALTTMLASGVVGLESAKRICGLLGFTRDCQDNLREAPIVSSLADGVGVGDYWLTAESARRSQAAHLHHQWHASRLTRSLLLAMREVCVTLPDCGTTHGIWKQLSGNHESAKCLSHRIVGRTSCETLRNAVSDELIVGTDELITPHIAAQIEQFGTTEVRVRSPITCEAPRGVCQKCYGLDRSTGELVALGTAVGLQAGYAIGECADTLTTRTFRYDPKVRRSTLSTGTQVVAGQVLAATIAHPWPDTDRPLGLVALEELLAAGPTKQTAVLAPQDGVVESIRFDDQTQILLIRDDQRTVSEIAISRDQALAVTEGNSVRAGEPLVQSGRCNPQDILRILGEEATAQYVLSEMRCCFEHQHIDIDDKHLELVIQRMLSLAEVNSPGDTDFVAGEIVERGELRREHERIRDHVKITESSDSNFVIGQLVAREVWQHRTDELVTQGKIPPVAQPTSPATATLRLFDIRHSRPSHGWSRLMPGFEAWNSSAMAHAALSGTSNHLDCVADRSIFGME